MGDTLVLPEFLRAGQLEDSFLRRAVREGDPASGWRGDPTMVAVRCAGPAGSPPCCLDRIHIEVYGMDRAGEWYRAAQVRPREEVIRGNEWRHELLVKLREGDWQRGSELAASITARNIANRDRIDAQRQEAVRAAGEKLYWAGRRDLGHHHGGLRKVVY